MNITENNTGKAPEEIFSLAARENNTKRGGLIVNLLQAKHVPAPPRETLALFDRLGETVKRGIKETSGIMVIGFAETATAIGARLAAGIGGDCIFITTTREHFPEKMRIALFSEEHSHAGEQNLYSDKGRDIFKNISHIIFAEDELTTGKTILNFIDALKDTVSCKFSAASVLNGMTEEKLEKFRSGGVELFWLAKTENSEEELKKQQNIRGGEDMFFDIKAQTVINVSVLPAYTDPRLGVSADFYERFCEKAAADIYNRIKGELRGRTADIIGTEECMYPALKLGEYLESRGFEVKSHSTTRSPIVPSKEKGYPLFSRYKTESLYDSARQTYIYNLYDCDNRIVITDHRG